jgi:hypothetical protein
VLHLRRHRATHFLSRGAALRRWYFEGVSTTEFREGDRVEYVGPPPRGPDEPEPGEQGTVITDDPPGAWVVRFDHAGTAVYGEPYLRRLKNGHPE